MALRYEDLPPTIRKQVDAAIASGVPHDGLTADVETARRVDPAKAGAWRCAACPYVPKSWRDALAHADRTQHRRIETRLEEVPPT